MVKRNVRKAKRSGTQPCPICESEVPLVEHHINGRCVPRWRENWNVVWVCPTCHDLIHVGDIIVEGWWRVNGLRVLSWRKKGDETIFGEGAKPPGYSDS